MLIESVSDQIPAPSVSIIELLKSALYCKPKKKLMVENIVPSANPSTIGLLSRICNNIIFYETFFNQMWPRHSVSYLYQC